MDLDNEASEIEPRAPRAAKVVRWVGLGFILVAALFIGVFLTSGVSPSFEPRWLVEIQPQRHEIMYVDGASAPRGHSSYLNGVVVQQTVRTVSMEFDAFVAKMRGDLNSRKEWKEFIPPTSRTATWSRHDANGDYTIWAMPVAKGQLSVSSSCLRAPTWVERVKHRFGWDKPKKPSP